MIEEMASSGRHSTRAAVPASCGCTLPSTAITATPLSAASAGPTRYPLRSRGRHRTSPSVRPSEEKAKASRIAAYPWALLGRLSCA